jgi:site-specific DNA-cytosine methylase
VTTILLPTRYEEIRHFHLFAGLGGGARGFNQGQARVGTTQARFRCIGGIDVDAAAVRDFDRLAGARGTCLDLFDRGQYEAWHGVPPPDGWKEAAADDIRRAAGGERPHILFGSAPCKGFSGLLSNERSQSARYQALNQLALRGLWLMLEAWADDPPELVLWENVPRISTRGRDVLDQMVALLRAYGYATAETTHDCGELGELAQHRKRFLLVARHTTKVPPFLYEPPKRGLRGVGEVIGKLPLPGATAAGPMHALRPLQWKTWVRLAFVEAGGDWRSLQKLRVVDGHLADFGIAPSNWRPGPLGVLTWGEPAGTVTGAAAPTTGRFSVADPRPSNYGEYAQLGIVPWTEPMGTVTAQAAVGGGRFAVSDPRVAWSDGAHRAKFKVVPWEQPVGTVTGSVGPQASAASVADPRLEGIAFNNVFRVIRFDQPAQAVTGPGGAGQAVADPRVERQQYSGLYGVVPWDAPAQAVTGAASHDNGRNSVADPRIQRYDEFRLETPPSLPAAEARLVAVIRALDGTWHRPFTTLELACLQSLIDPEDLFALDGTSDTAWRERIGNAVPPAAAAAIASEMGRTLLLAWSGETFALSSTPIWVRPIAIALSVQSDQEPA